MSGTEVEVYATVHLEIVCSCGAELVVKKHPGSINCCEAIEVEPCQVCLKKTTGNRRDRTDLQRERELADSMEGNPAYFDGYRDALDGR